MSDKTIQIYVSCHKPCKTFENEIVTPVFQQDVIRFLSQGSAEDRFMAEHANEYCELLTQYWAWKYCEADYYGFCHYRRYFAFSDAAADGDGIVRRRYLCDETASELSVADTGAIAAGLDRCDVLTPYPIDYYVKSGYWQYKNSDVLKIEDLDLVLEIIREEYPEYAAAANKYIGGHRLYFCNMFIMRKELFCAYSEWLFSILHRFYERKDMRACGYDTAALRTPGHLGERLFGMYLTWLKMQKKYTFTCRHIALFENTDEFTPLMPAFTENDVPILIPVWRQSVVYAAAALRSVVRNACEENRYDVVFLSEGLSESEQEKLASTVRGMQNFSVRFVEAGRVFFPLQRKGTTIELTDVSALMKAFPDHKRALWLNGYELFRQDAATFLNEDTAERLTVCRGADVEVLPRRAKKEVYPAARGGYSGYFWSLLKDTPYFGLSEEEKAKLQPCRENVFWRFIFKLFPERTKAGVLVRKVRRTFRKK